MLYRGSMSVTQCNCSVARQATIEILPLQLVRNKTVQVQSSEAGAGGIILSEALGDGREELIFFLRGSGQRFCLSEASLTFARFLN